MKPRSFLPPAFIWGPDTCFTVTPAGTLLQRTLYDGDNRSYNAFTNDYRSTHEIMLTSAGVMLPSPSDPVGPGYRNSALSKRYAANALQPDGKTLKEDVPLHDCWYLDNTGYADRSNMQAASSLQSSGPRINFYGGASNPVHPVYSPEISWNVTILINTFANPVTPAYTVNYTHDCFPAYEVYHGSQLLYGFTPPAAANPTPYIAYTAIGPCLVGFGQIVGSSFGTIF